MEFSEQHKEPYGQFAHAGFGVTYDCCIERIDVSRWVLSGSVSDVVGCEQLLLYPVMLRLAFGTHTLLQGMPSEIFFHLHPVYSASSYLFLLLHVFRDFVFGRVVIHRKVGVQFWALERSCV
jgi:hypothetical protein